MLSIIQKRFLLFLFGCIGTRLAIALIAKTVSVNALAMMGYIALIPAIGFMSIYFFGLRERGAEVFGERIWWNDLRPIHALLYFGFAYLAINRNRDAWLLLMADAAIGLSSFLWHHYNAGNMQKIFQ